MFIPTEWPEEPVPAEFAGCRECARMSQGTRMVWGEGNPLAPVMIVLDNPGAREDREGNPFVCGTRQTLQQTAAEAGLCTEQLYLTYLLKWRPVRKYDKPTARGACLVHLRQQIAAKSPKLLVCLGNTAVQSYFDDPDAQVKNLRGQWHIIGGIPVTVSYHPLAVRRRPVLKRFFAEDLQSVADKLLKVAPCFRTNV